MTTQRTLPIKLVLSISLIILCNATLWAQVAELQLAQAAPAPGAPAPVAQAQAAPTQGAPAQTPPATGAPAQAGQVPPPETRIGCLTVGPREGTTALVEDMTGQQFAITGLAIQSLKLDQKVTATGNMVRRGNADTFEATKIEPANMPCEVGFSADALKRSIGHARLGVRGGIGMDPELIILGVQAEFGPIFKNIWIRPTSDFAFGEVTKIYSINPEFTYYLPFVGHGSNQSRWAAYVGTGPAFTIERRSFKGFPDQPVDMESDWDTDLGLNMFVGFAQSTGMFFELKAAVSSTPNVRLFVGYSFK